MKEHGGEPIIPFSGVLESKLFDMPDDEKATYLKEVHTQQSLVEYHAHIKSTTDMHCKFT